MNKVYIVEDDEIIAKTIANHLKTWQMEVRCTKDFQNIMQEIASCIIQSVESK